MKIATQKEYALMNTGYPCLEPERFKTRAAHFSIQRDERTGMQRATLSKSGSDANS